MAAIAILWRSQEYATLMTSFAARNGVRTGQRKARQAMVNLCASRWPWHLCIC